MTIDQLLELSPETFQEMPSERLAELISELDALYSQLQQENEVMIANLSPWPLSDSDAPDPSAPDRPPGNVSASDPDPPNLAEYAVLSHLGHPDRILTDPLPDPPRPLPPELEYRWKRIRGDRPIYFPLFERDWLWLTAAVDILCGAQTDGRAQEPEPEDMEYYQTAFSSVRSMMRTSFLQDIRLAAWTEWSIRLNREIISLTEQNLHVNEQIARSSRKRSERTEAQRKILRFRRELTDARQKLKEEQAHPPDLEAIERDRADLRFMQAIPDLPPLPDPPSAQ